MTVYVKRSPLKDLNPVILLQNVEEMKAERMRAEKCDHPRHLKSHGPSSELL